MVGGAACGGVCWRFTQPSIASGHDVVAFVVSSCFGLCCLPGRVLQLGDTSACKMVYNTVQHVTSLISFLTAAVVVNSSDETVVLVFNGCDEAVVKYFCRDCAFFCRSTCVLTLWIARLILVVWVCEELTA